MGVSTDDTGTVTAPITISRVNIRPPTNPGINPPATSSTFIPSTSFLTGTWHVTHSTLPMWRKARNVAITYTPLSDTSASPKLDDKVTYQGLTSDKLKTVSGIDTPAGDGAWDWRGKGWLMIASSHWQTLGYGGEGDGEAWIVTFFAKTLFTPAGIDVYSRQKEGLGAETLEEVKNALEECESEEVRRLMEGLFEVRRD